MLRMDWKCVYEKIKEFDKYCRVKSDKGSFCIFLEHAGGCLPIKIDRENSNYVMISHYIRPNIELIKKGLFNELNECVI